MCRNIKPLFNLDPTATPAEIEAAARQFVRKISGSNKPSKTNEAPVELAVQEISATLTTLLQTLVPPAPPRDRDLLAAQHVARQARRFGERS